MTMPKEIVLATGNAGKAREISALFADLDVQIVAQSALGIESPEETGSTFVENALLKAHHAAGVAGLPALADDSGIAVDALGGRPGVWSARYAGPAASDVDNVDLLLSEMHDVVDDQRGAGFHCAAVLVFPDSQIEPLVVESVWRGTVLRERQGEGGFGYDPVFFDSDLKKTGAQMSKQEKNQVSHRGKAFRELRERLANL